MTLSPKNLLLLFACFWLTASAQAADIGVDYHSFTSDFSNDSVLTRYHQVVPGQAPTTVRQEAQYQLARMKKSGVDFVSTRIYVGAPAGSNVDSRLNPYLMAFPPTPQDLANLATYVDDVKSAGLTLDLGFLWLGQADYTVGCVNEGDDGTEEAGCNSPKLGHGNLSLSTFKTNLRSQTIAKILQQIDAGDVRNFYFDGEVLYHPNPSALPIGDQRRKRRNENWFFENGYGYFAHILTRDGKGQPMVYFLPTVPADPSTTGGILNNTWHNLADPEYPATMGHRTMYWPYRSMLFIEQTFAAKGWPSSWMFDRFDFSFYADTHSSALYDDWADRMLDDAYAVIVSRFGLSGVGFAEANYFGDYSKRAAYCSALHAESGRLDFFAFWTTRYSAERVDYGNVEVAFPTNLSGC